MARKKENYVDNPTFTQAVHEYVLQCKEAEECGDELPRVSNYIGDCFYKIASNLTNTRKFIRRTYKDELIMDAVEDCLRRIQNYNIDATTRTGKPNAFAYFTQICYFSFLRTVEKHNKELKKKLKFIEKTAIEVSANTEYGDTAQVLKYLDDMRDPWKEKLEETDKPKSTKTNKKGLEKFSK